MCDRGGLTTDFDGRFEFQQVGLADENFAALQTEVLDVFFGERNLLSRFAAADLQQLGDHGVDFFVFHLHY